MPPKGILVYLTQQQQEQRDREEESSGGVLLANEQSLEDKELGENGVSKLPPSTNSSSSYVPREKKRRKRNFTPVNSRSQTITVELSGSEYEEEFEVCEGCGLGGQVLQCDAPGCDRLWHVKCIPELKGMLPKGRWLCPAMHEEVCAICERPGQVIICDMKGCGRLYHLDCLPQLGGNVPRGIWECPYCIEERETGLVCSICLKQTPSPDDKETELNGHELSNIIYDKDRDNLVKCSKCSEACHLTCLSKFDCPGSITCPSCNLNSRYCGLVQPVKVTLNSTVNDIDRARIVQIIRGESSALQDFQASAFLDFCVMKKSEHIDVDSSIGDGLVVAESIVNGNDISPNSLSEKIKHENLNNNSILFGSNSTD